MDRVYGSIVGNQLAQTLAAGWDEGRPSRSIAGAVGGSAGLLAATLALAPLRNVLGLTAPGPVAWRLIGPSAATSVLMNRILTTNGVRSPRALPEPDTNGAAASHDGPTLLATS